MASGTQPGSSPGKPFTIKICTMKGVIMYKALYEVTSVYPYFYRVSIVWYGKEYKRLVDIKGFTAWADVVNYADQYDADLVFDGLI